MKFLLFTLFSIGCLNINAQLNNQDKIDTSNYYSYYTNISKSGRQIYTAWLQDSDVIPHLLKKLNQYGFENLRTYSIYKIQSGQQIILTVYSAEFNFGLIFNGCHFFPIDKTQRGRGCRSDYEYIDFITDYNKNIEVIRVKNLPSNIYTITANSYWYQYSDNKDDDEYLVTKTVAFKLLNEDLDALIKRIKIDIKDNFHQQK